MASKVVGRAVVAEDRCDLCGAGLDGAFSARTRHLRKEHPAYARGLLLRIVAPLVFMASIIGLQAVKAPVWTGFAATIVTLGLAGLGIAQSRSAREASGAKKTGLGTLMKEGGLRFVLIAGLITAMVVLAAIR